MTSQRYPVGVQSFTKLREGNYLYVDKTEYIRYLESRGVYFFLSRPRRFGKSMFVSTLEAYFQGRKELFKGLAIDREDTDWTPRPVFKFALNGLDGKEKVDLEELLNYHFLKLEEVYGKSESETSFFLRFYGLLERAYEKTGRKVAILFDEYDAPLLQTLNDPQLNERYRNILKSVFTVLKNGDEYIHFAFITGVSRFSHTSLFSGANNIPDVSMRDDLAAICGITEDELKRYFAPGIRSFAEEHEISEEETLRLFKENYDGYHFARKSPDIYNPYSLLQAFDSNTLEDYWFESGTPTYLIEAIKRDEFELPEMDCIEVPVSMLTAKESFMQNPVALMYETGYLTIKEYDKRLDSCVLGIPNREVGRGLSTALLPIYSKRNGLDVNSWILKFRRAVLDGDAELFMSLLQTFMEGNPYSNTELDKRESYFKNNIYLIFKMLGFRPETEKETCNARTDVVLETPDYVYLFELKTNRTAGEALRQIDEKGYARPFLHDGRRIVRIGANYSSVTNNIDSWVIA